MIGGGLDMTPHNEVTVCSLFHPLYFHMSCSSQSWNLRDAVAESVERRLPMCESRNVVPSLVKPITYKIDTCRLQGW